MTDVLELHRLTRVIPVIRRPDPDSAIEACHAVLALGEAAARETGAELVAGWPEIIELTATTPDWPRVLASVRAAVPHVVTGLGTVTDGETAALAIDTGASFLVSPYPAAEVRSVADAAGVPFIEGGFTPGEIAASARHGVAKLFPAASAGPGYLRSVLDVIPGARVIPTGGIGLDRVGDWLAAGAYAVGAGGGLVSRPDAAGLLAAALAGRR
ncbi:MAG: bifunctional 4-hydroxy-2-oxoglutarate aldolase/2-dehydro-3-deoxy-phosphogluconate aldolase [Streptosporangiaceae bacterium]|nr:bifunctional 4-hydroxy-2-oxoglutarate aldolase/2-dehydro-3-deoxy-phosphogluconate aldolase [Streptosporangiaceae bacterium]